MCTATEEISSLSSFLRVLTVNNSTSQNIASQKHELLLFPLNYRTQSRLHESTDAIVYLV